MNAPAESGSAGNSARSGRSPRPASRFPLAAAIGTILFAALFMGTVLVYVPYTLTEWRLAPPLLGRPSRWLGAALVIFAIPPMLAFLVQFVREGHGTPAPFAPPRQLVVHGLFRHVRNPAYLCAMALVAGQGLYLGSPGTLLYAALLALAFHLFVVFYEEPTLRATFGAEYEAYCRRVPRWLPRVRGTTLGACLALALLASCGHKTRFPTAPVPSVPDRFVLGWGSLGSGDGQFAFAGGVAVDKLGHVYVADLNNHRIQKFTSGGVLVTKWGSPGTGDGQFANPIGVALDAAGNVYVADFNNDRMQKFDSNGGFITKWGSVGSGPGQFYRPRFVAVDANGHVFVTDWVNSRVQKFDASGSYLGEWGGEGSAAGQFKYATGIAVSPDGFLYVADWGNRRIQKFTADGAFLAEWGSPGSGNGQFNDPEGVAVDRVGNVLVVDNHNDGIQMFTSSGAYIARWGATGMGDGQFQGPMGIAAAPPDTIYVTDDRRVQKFGP